MGIICVTSRFQEMRRPSSKYGRQSLANSFDAPSPMGGGAPPPMGGYGGYAGYHGDHRASPPGYYDDRDRRTPPKDLKFPPASPRYYDSYDRDMKGHGYQHHGRSDGYHTEPYPQRTGYRY